MPTNMHTTTGSNVTPSPVQYRCFDRRKIKKAVEAYKTYTGTTRKVPATIKSALAYFCNGKSVNE
jgi:hypothetical protein